MCWDITPLSRIQKKADQSNVASTHKLPPAVEKLAETMPDFAGGGQTFDATQLQAELSDGTTILTALYAQLAPRLDVVALNQELMALYGLIREILHQAARLGDAEPAEVWRHTLAGLQ